MFVLKSTHNREVALYESVITSLKEQIDDLRKLVFVSEPSETQTLPIRAANAILDGQEVIPTTDPRKDAEDLAEANRILSGEYDQFNEDIL